MYYLEINVQKCHIQIKSLKCLDLLRILFKKNNISFNKSLKIHLNISHIPYIIF